MFATESLLISLCATIALFGGTWLLLNAKQFEQANQARLLGATGLAAAGFLLSRLSLDADANTPERLLGLFRINTAFFLLVCGLAPWAAPGQSITRPPLTLILFSAALALLLIVNHSSDASLIYTLESLKRHFEFGLPVQPSPWTIAIAASTFASFAILAKSAFRLHLDENPKAAIVLGLAAFSLPATYFWDFSELGKLAPEHSIAWSGVTLLVCTLIFQGILQKKQISRPRPPLSPKPASTPIIALDSPTSDSPPQNADALLLWFDRENLAILSKLLSARGYTPLTEDDPFFNYQTFLDASPASPPLLLVDLGNADRDRLEAIHIPLHTLNRPRIIAFADDLNAPSLRRRLRANALDAILQKPPRAKELFRELTTLESIR